jgi:acyl carrier protein
MYQRILALFSEKLQIEVPDPQADLIEAGLLDSLVFVDLMMHLEAEFHVELFLDDLDIDQFRSVVGIAGFVNRVAATQPQAIV